MIDLFPVHVCPAGLAGPQGAPHQPGGLRALSGLQLPTPQLRSNPCRHSRILRCCGVGRLSSPGSSTNPDPSVAAEVPPGPRSWAKAGVCEKGSPRFHTRLLPEPPAPAPACKLTRLRASLQAQGLGRDTVWPAGVPHALQTVSVANACHWHAGPRFLPTMRTFCSQEVHPFTIRLFFRSPNKCWQSPASA